MATAEELAIVRSWAGTAVTEGDINEPLARLASPEAVALELLRQRRADLLADPQSFTAAGDVSYDWGDRLADLDRTIGDLERRVGAAAGSSVSTAKLRRLGPRR